MSLSAVVYRLVLDTMNNKCGRLDLAHTTSSELDDVYDGLELIPSE